MQEQTQLTFYNVSKEEASKKGYPINPRTEDWMNTISVKLPNGNYITFCVMQTSKDETCVDTKFHGDNLKDHRLLAMGGEGKDENVYNKNIYALIAHAAEIK